MREWILALLAAGVIWGVGFAAPNELAAQMLPSDRAQNAAYQFNRYYYYPYCYYPHNYWPVTGPKWPEAPGDPYMRPPAYMAFPAFREQNWRYEYYMPQKYYHGQHFLLDQF